MAPNKRKKESNSKDENKTNKKEKVDDNNSEGDEEWMNINIKSLDKMKLPEVIKIAELVGIGSKGKKVELIEKIKNVINNRKELLDKNEKESKNSTAFNGYIELKIKEINNEERLFWRVFKNKYIFKSIMSKLNSSNLNTIPYDSIIDVGYMLENNQISILKDKVKRNQYLVFTNRIQDLYSNIELSDNLEFYKGLFKNYNNYIPKFDEPNSMLYTLSENNCRAGLQVYFENHSGGKITEYNLSSCFRIAIEHGSLDVVSFILSLDKYKPESKDYYKPLFSAPPSMITVGLHRNIQKVSKRYKSIVYFVEEVKVVPAFSSNQDIKESKKDEYKEKVVKSLLCYCPILCQFKLIDLVNVCKIIKFLLIDDDKVNEILDSYQQHFTIQQLESTITDTRNNDSIRILLNYYNSQSDKEYKDGSNLLIQLYYPSSQELKQDFTGFYERQTFLKNSGLFSKNEKIYQYSELALLGLKHANHQLVSEWFEVIQVSTLLLHNAIIFKKEHGSILFKHCSDKNKQIEFLDLTIKDINNESIPYFKKLSPILLFCSLVEYDDIELIKYSSKKNGFPNLTTVDAKITHYINSIEMLDYLYQEFPTLFDLEVGCIWFGFKKLEYLKKFEELVKKRHGEYIFPLKLEVSEESSFPSLPIVKHIVENPKLYDYNATILDKKPFDLNNDNTGEFISILKYLVNNTDLKFNPLAHFKASKYHYCELPPYILQFLNYLLNCYPLEEFKEENGRFYLGNDKTLFKIQYLTCRINSNEDIEFFPIKFSNVKDASLIEYSLDLISTRCDIKTFDLIMTEVYRKNSKDSKSNNDLISQIKYIILLLLSSVAEYGHLRFFEHIQLKHSCLLKKKTPSNDGFFTQLEFRDVLFLPLQFDYIQLAEFFFQFYEITKQQLNQYSKLFGISSTYFKDRFKK